MSAIQLLESLAKNPNFKEELLKGSNASLASEVQSKLDELEKTDHKIWCVFVPAEDENEESGEEPDKKDDEKDKDSGISLH